MPKLLKTNHLWSTNMNNEFKIVRCSYFLLVLNMNDIFSFLLGIPVYFSASLIEIFDWGGTDAASLKKGIDNILEDKGRVPLKEDEHKHKIVNCTLDGASVSFGRNTGLMARLAIDHPWLIKYTAQIIELNWQLKVLLIKLPSVNVTHFKSETLPS